MKRKTKLFNSALACLTGAFLCGGTAALAQPSISNVYPNGTNMFQPSATLSFTVTSGSGVTNVVVNLTSTNLYTGSILLGRSTSASGLTIAGTTYSAPLSPNCLYGATITAYDANGSSSITESFDTISPSYTWEAEDFDYNGGSHFEQGVDQYANLAGIEGTDYHNGNPNNGNASYRPKGLETENPNSADLPLRLQYIGTTNFDFDVGWTANGDWGNYTHAYPPGTYVVFVRASGGNGPVTDAGQLSIVAGTASSTNTAPFSYNVKGRGWGSYDFMPLIDANNNPVQITFDGSVCTLQELQVNNDDNLNFFMLMPVPTVQASTVTIGSVTPDGSVQFQASNNLSFVVSSPVAINLSSVQVQLTATTLFGSNSTALLSIGSGLTYTGNSTNITVTGSLTTNVVYSGLILANDANGVQTAYSIGFDTIVPAFTFEAEDWNYGGGQWVASWTPDCYAGLDGVAETDFHRPNGSTLGSYNREGLDTENCGDTKRATYLTPTGSDQDYDIGNTTGGDWANYTRMFPAGTYNMFVRVSRGNGGNVTDAGSIALVTSDPTTSPQTTQVLGTHNTPSTGGWQSYVWMPIMNTGGYPAQFTADGTAKTLRYNFDGAGDNINFVLLLPAVGGNPPPYVSSFTPDGSALFQPSNTLNFVVNSSVGIPQSGVTLNLNGVNVSGLTFSGSSSQWNVSHPIKVNGAYTAIITLTDTAGTTHYTNTFYNFASTDYQFEAEDYDYNDGQYITPENTVDGYQGLGGVSGTDYFEGDPNGPGRGENYRAATSTAIPDAVAGDLPRAQFTAVNGTDYNIGSFGIGSWANYTRHYPAGTYNVMGRFTEGAGLAGAALAVLQPGVSTNELGTFTVQNDGWSSWQWQELMDASGSPAVLTLDGNLHTLQLQGTTGNEVNVNFLMLVPAAAKPAVTAGLSGGNVTLSFLTQSGFSYQVQYKNNLTDATWTSLGSALSGNGSVQSASDTPAGNAHRFYRVQVQ